MDKEMKSRVKDLLGCASASIRYEVGEFMRINEDPSLEDVSAAFDAAMEKAKQSVRDAIHRPTED